MLTLDLAKFSGKSQAYKLSKSRHKSEDDSFEIGITAITNLHLIYLLTILIFVLHPLILAKVSVLVHTARLFSD